MVNDQQIHSLRENVRLLVRKLELLNKNEAICCGISLTHCHALVEIGRAEALSINQLSNLLGLDKSTLSRTVDNMVCSNLVERYTDPDDRRYVQIKLTTEGLHVYREIEKSMETYFKEVILNIPEEKRDQVVDSLNYLLKALPSKCN